MQNIIKNVINRGGYDLTAILRKVDTLWAEGQLTDEERTELAELARTGANVSDSADLFAKLNDLEKRVRALEDGSDNGSEAEDFPKYTAGKWYYNGDQCSFEGVNYKCIAPDGQVCTWSPKEYPAYWEKVK